MAPKQGDMILVKGINNNGSVVHPAIVTQVFTPNMVNVKIFVDFGPVIDRGSVQFFESRDAAMDYEQAQTATPVFVAFPRD